jgi:hypothetical protein
MSPIQALTLAAKHKSCKSYLGESFSFQWNKDESDFNWNDSPFNTCKELLIQDVALHSKKRSFGLVMEANILQESLRHNLNLILPQKYVCKVAYHDGKFKIPTGESLEGVSIVIPSGLWASNIILADIFVIITRLTTRYGKIQTLNSLISKLKVFTWLDYNYYDVDVEKLLRNLHSKESELRRRNFKQRYFMAVDLDDLDDWEEVAGGYMGIVENAYSACKFLKI